MAVSVTEKTKGVALSTPASLIQGELCLLREPLSLFPFDGSVRIDIQIEVMFLPRSDVRFFFAFPSSQAGGHLSQSSGTLCDLSQSAAARPSKSAT